MYQVFICQTNESTLHLCFIFWQWFKHYNYFICDFFLQTLRSLQIPHLEWCTDSVDLNSVSESVLYYIPLSICQGLCLFFWPLDHSENSCLNGHCYNQPDLLRISDSTQIEILPRKCGLILCHLHFIIVKLLLFLLPSLLCNPCIYLQVAFFLLLTLSLMIPYFLTNNW